jgi:serine/threonine protein phosphatase PrpC
VEKHVLLVVNDLYDKWQLSNSFHKKRMGGHRKEKVLHYVLQITLTSGFELKNKVFRRDIDFIKKTIKESISETIKMTQEQIHAEHKGSKIIIRFGQLLSM